MSSVPSISTADLEKLIETTTKEVLRGMNTSDLSMASSHTKIIEKTTKEVLKEINTSIGPSIVSLSLQNNSCRPIDSSGLDVWDVESSSALVSTLGNTIEIIRWCLAFCQLGGDCCIVGHIYHEGAWILYRTSYIRSVHENGRLIYDDDGNYFHIIGGLTPSTFDEFSQLESDAVQLTFLPETIAAFKDGIPPNYRMWVQRIAYEAQKQPSFSRTYDYNEAKASLTNDIDCRGERKEKAGEDKAASIFGWEWEPGPQLRSDVRHVTDMSPKAKNEANVDLDAEEESCETRTDSDSNESEEEEEEEEEEEDLPSDGESCENYVSRKLSRNPFKAFFYDKMVERTQALVALRKKREKRNRQKSEKEAWRNLRNRRRNKGASSSDGPENNSPVSSRNEEQLHHHLLSFPVEKNQEISSSHEEKRFTEKSFLNCQLSFADEKSREVSSRDTGRDSLVMLSSAGELSNNEVSSDASHRDAWSVLNHAPSPQSDFDDTPVSSCDPKRRLELSVQCQRLSLPEENCEAERRLRLRKRPWLDTASGSNAREFAEPPRSVKRKKASPKLRPSPAPATTGRRKSRKRPHGKQKEADTNASLSWRNVSFFGAPKAAAAAASVSPFVLRTLSGAQVDVRHLTHTRSGRLSCPPLDAWRGQRIATDPAGNITEVHHGQEDRFYSHRKSSYELKAKQTKAAPHKIRVKAVTERRKGKQKRQAVHK